MANYDVTITGGTGSANMKAGTYTVTANVPGYDNATINPTTYTATTSAGTGTFTVTANGTLTFNVNETGAQGGTPVTGGTIIMTDATGNTTYGTAVNIGTDGNAVFNNVPFGNTTAPFVLYFKQLTTDDGHNIYEEVIKVNMSAQTQTEYIQNLPIAAQTITLTDANYSGLPLDGTLTFTGN